MRIHPRDLAAGDVLALNDWRLHVVAVEYDNAVGVRTTEFGFLIHFLNDEIVEIRTRRPEAA
jgi:hypothetical protein